MEQCANCGRVIGKLETPHIWQVHVVCAACSTALSVYPGKFISTEDSPVARLASPQPLGSQSEAPSLLTCPNCHSEETASFQMIYQQGTSTSLMGGIDSRGDLFAGRSTAISSLAAKTAPPEKKPVGPAAAGLVIGACGAFVSGATAINMILNPSFPDTRASGISPLIIAIVFLGLAMFSLSAERSAKLYNAREYPAQYSAWLRRWMCKRCGNVFVKKDP